MDLLETRQLFSDKFRYALGPFIAVAANGDWLVTFNMSVRREVGPHSPKAYLHPPMDPDYCNYIIRSTDQGRTWDAPRALPGFEWRGTEHVALCVLENGEILGSHYQRVFFPLETAEKHKDRFGWNYRPPYPWVVTHGGTYVHRSTDHGLTWDETVEIDASPFISAYSPRNIVELPDGRLIFTAGAADPMFSSPLGFGKPPNVLLNGMGNRLVDGEIVREPSTVFICVSHDQGRTWPEIKEIARHEELYFVEPAMVLAASGRLVCHLRNCRQTGHLWQVVSDDGGETWSAPEMTPIWGHPAHLVCLGDGRLLSVYGHRRDPIGIRACVSKDEGNTWDYENEYVIRDDMVSHSIGYPVSIVLEDDSIFTVYWNDNAEGITSIDGSHYRV
jgi:hypothetical protein